MDVKKLEDKKSLKSNRVLCCVDCENPLVDGYCNTCKYPPSMQDTFFKNYDYPISNEQPKTEGIL